MKNRHIKLNYILGLSGFILYALSFLIGYEETASDNILMYIKAGLITVSVVFYFYSCRSDSDECIKTHFSLLTAVILSYHVLLLSAVGSTIFYIRDYPAILNSILWITCCTMVLMRYRKQLFSFFSSQLSSPDNRKLIFSSTVIALIVIVLSIEPNGIMFTWDSDTLYEFIYRQDFRSLYDAKLLTFHSHVSIVYAHILVLLKLLFNNIRIAFFILNSFCVFIASFGMTHLIKTILPKETTVIYTLANSLFMLSPWICGLSTYHIYDYYIWCLFPLLILFMLRKNWIGFFTVGVLLSFSKSTGLVVFGSVCISILLMACINRIKGKNHIYSVLLEIKYWYFLSVAIVFYIFFKSGISEATQFEDVQFGINISHILQQLKIYYTSNFLWIYTALSVILLILIIKHKPNITDYVLNVIMILITSDVIFIVFNCLCITYRLPRYMDSHIPIMYVLGVISLICLIKSRKVVRISMMLLCFISFASSFRTFDPVSMFLFNTMDVGDHRIIDYEVAPPSLGDSIVYNREYYSYEVLLDKVLTYVTASRTNDAVILFSLGDDTNTWGVSGGRYSYTYSDNKRLFELYYDKSIPGLANGYDYEYHNTESMTPLNIRYIFGEESIANVVSSDMANQYIYIYMPSINLDRESYIFNNFNIISEEQFSFRGWHMNCILFERL